MFVLLGEASHGTSEYYSDRAEWSKRLITEYGFCFIAVEGDWPSCYTLNRYVKGYPDTGTDVREALNDFARVPEAMKTAGKSCFIVTARTTNGCFSVQSRLPSTK